MAAQQAVVENEVHAVMFPAFGDAELPGLETKAAPEFQEEALEVIEECRLKLFLRVGGEVAEAGELQHVGIAQLVGDGLWRLLFPGAFDEGFLAGGEPGALVEEAPDLALELADGPVAFQALGEIVKSWKQFTSTRVKTLLAMPPGRFWQPEAYDHWVRDDADRVRIVRYIHNDPVKAKLCALAEDWPWSSASKK